MSSPCIKLCKLDPEHQVCIGCLRTAKEISNWSKLPSREQTAILDDIAWVRSNIYNFKLDSANK